jgi:hypothetical protein
MGGGVWGGGGGGGQPQLWARPPPPPRPTRGVGEGPPPPPRPPRLVQGNRGGSPPPRPLLAVPAPALAPAAAPTPPTAARPLPVSGTSGWHLGQHFWPTAPQSAAAFLGISRGCAAAGPGLAAASSSASSAAAPAAALHAPRRMRAWGRRPRIARGAAAGWGARGGARRPAGASAGARAGRGPRRAARGARRPAALGVCWGPAAPGSRARACRTRAEWACRGSREGPGRPTARVAVRAGPGGRGPGSRAGAGLVRNGRRGWVGGAKWAGL